MNIFNAKSTIYKEDRNHEPLDSWQQRKKIHRAKVRKDIGKKKMYIIIVRHVNISLRIFYPVQKK